MIYLFYIQLSRNESMVTFISEPNIPNSTTLSVEERRVKESLERLDRRLQGK